ncbi:MAG: hypothetical protein WCW66_05050 [Patescibacteria group bacterium]|jgi:hypothetical protein
MNEQGFESDFDIEQFRTILAAKTEEFATDSYITYGSESNQEENERKKMNAAELRGRLLVDCAEALLKSNDAETVMSVIREALVYYRYGNGSELFPGRAKEDFYYDLALAIAKAKNE